jgi:sugar phosphate isomerase/epimerase
MNHGAFLNLLHCDPTDWERQLNDLDRLEDLDHLELWLEFLPSRPQLLALADFLEGRRTIMHGPFIGMSLATNWDELARVSLDRVLRAVEIASYLGSEVVTIHGGIVHRDEDQEAVIDRLVGYLERLSHYCDPVIALENMAGRGGATREAIARTAHLTDVMARLPALQVTLDTGHALQNNDDPVEFVAAHAGRIANIHLHDAHPGGKGHLRLGTAALDTTRLLNTLDATGYDRFLTLETVSAEDTSASWKVIGRHAHKIGT